jgi:hypothetical protein
MEAYMLKISNAANFRRTLGGLCLIVAPVLQVVDEKISPGNNSTWSASGELETVTRQNGLFVESAHLGILAGILFIPALLAILHVVRGRGVVLAHVGVGLTLVGIVLFMFVSQGANLMVSVMGMPGLDPTAMTALLQHALGGTSAVTSAWLGLFLEIPGLLLVGLAVWRSGFGYRWAGPLIVLWILADTFNPFHSEVVGYLIAAMGVVGLGAIGLRILTMPGSAWDSAPSPANHPAPVQVPHAEPVVGS